MSAVIPDPALTDWVPLGGVGGGGSMIALQEVVVPAGGQASIDFAAIPQIYAHLKLLFVGRGTVAAAALDCVMRLNDDAAANYDLATLTGNNNAASSAEQVAATAGSPFQAPGASAPAGSAVTAEVTIPDYRSAFHKAVIGHSHLRTINTVPGLWHMARSFDWRSTAAITKITLASSAGLWDAGSRATLYGLAAPSFTLPLTGVRAVWGRVNADGTVAGGTGFTSAKTATGKYTITFNTPFASAPAVTVTGQRTQTANFVAPSVEAVAAGSASVGTYQSGTGFADTAFSFIAMEAA